MRYQIAMILVLCLIPLASAATLQGAVYNDNLEVEKDVLLEIDTTPAQKLLSKDGNYAFELLPGTYTLEARKGLITVTEKVLIQQEGTFKLDLFLLPDFTDEDELWAETDEDLLAGVEEESSNIWSYIIAGLFLAFAVWRIVAARKRYGSLGKFRKKMKIEQSKTIEEHKEDLAQEPGYVEKALEIIKKHDGRISQKELRKEMAYLSEAKVSLIITELEHKSLVEKVKKGRGNVILLKTISEG
ncbi:hypothetical protein COV20_02650 [Candidatus Woesearchaeota archaeon CG10_big_fil_rev_8_21_14_0_10_45_16]|nr:MAG: hypothetical protein COV20_02650 [Candidatus Woesearchaeota archaeon CG10_big_fil_rev_8_21_14_0_10_45_16]